MTGMDADRMAALLAESERARPVYEDTIRRLGLPADAVSWHYPEGGPARVSMALDVLAGIADRATVPARETDEEAW